MSESTNPTAKLKIGDTVLIDYDFFAKRFGADFINIPNGKSVKGKVIAAKYPGDLDDYDKEDYDKDFVYDFTYIDIDITDNDPIVQQRKKYKKKENSNKRERVDGKPIHDDVLSDLNTVQLLDDDLPFVTKIEGGGRRRRKTKHAAKSKRSSKRRVRKTRR